MCNYNNVKRVADLYQYVRYTAFIKNLKAKRAQLEKLIPEISFIRSFYLLLKTMPVFIFRSMAFIFQLKRKRNGSLTFSFSYYLNMLNFCTILFNFSTAHSHSLKQHEINGQQDCRTKIIVYDNSCYFVSKNGCTITFLNFA